MVRLVPVILLLALAACANRGIPANQSSERPDWLPVQPDHYDRYPAPEDWNQAKRRPAEAPPRQG